MATTSYNRAKPFAWSYSRLKNYETCPYRHKRIDVDKSYKDESEALQWGNEVHDRLAKACSGVAELPDTMKEYQHWVDRLVNKPGLIKTELKLAITEDFQPCDYFARDVWYRGVADVVRLQGKLALAIDWKTGKIIEDSVQLALMAQCVFSHFPTVEICRTDFIWLKDDANTTEVFKREDMPEFWAGLLPRVKQLANAYETKEFLPKPGHLCRKWCPVLDCRYHGV